MMNIKKYYWLVLLLLPFLAQADYQLSNADSSINFISIKKNAIAEVHSFTQAEGSVNSSGLANISIALSSVETNIDIRNQRMQSMLFETDMFPQASVSSQLDIAQLQGLTVGGQQLVSVDLNFDIHGQTKVIRSQLHIVGLADGAFLVSPAQPIILNAADFSLVSGIQKLMTVAGLPSIAHAVPLTFNLVFKPI